MGKVVEWSIKDLCDVINKMLDISFDCIIFIEGRRGLGKTQTKGSKVLMKNGMWKNVEDIKIRDEIISPQKDGSFGYAKVIDIHSRFEKNIYEVREVTRNKKVLYECAFNHIIPTWTRQDIRIKGNWKKRNYERKLVYLTAEELSKRYIKASHYTTFSTTAIDYNKKDCKIEPYSLGIFLGDGSYTCLLNITTQDFEVIDEISNYYPIMKIYKKKNTKAKQFRFSLRGKFAEELTKLDLKGKRSGTKFIPKECLLSSINYRFKLLAGLIDSDGYVMKKRDNHIEITTKSKQLSGDIKNLVFSLGGYSSIRKIKKRCNDYVGEYYCVKIAFENPQIIPLRTWKKQRLGNAMKHNPRHIAIECVKSKPQMVYGFELDKTQTKSQWYITDNWMVTHNSTLAYQICRRAKIPFNPWKDIAYTRDDIIKSLATKKKGAIFGDELINVAYNRDFYEQDQKVLLKALNMYRDHCNLFIGCIPSFVDLDKQIQRMCKIRITVIRRGVALIHMKVDTLFADDPWDIDHNKKLERKWGKGRHPKYMQLTTVKGILRFSDLSDKQKGIYLDVKEDKRNRVYSEYTEGEQEDSKKAFINRLYKAITQKKLTREEFDKLILLQGSSIKIIRVRLNEMLKDNGIEQTLQHFLPSEKEKWLEKRKELGNIRARRFRILRPKKANKREGQDIQQQQDNELNHIKTSGRKVSMWD